MSEQKFLDDEGTTFASREDAMAHARRLADQLVRSTGAAKGAIVVENEDAGDMFEVPLTLWNH